MRKIFVTIMIMLWTTLTDGKAQNIYNEIKNNAFESVKNETSNTLVKQISQFKLDALDYLLLKMREQMPDSTTSFLDKQAYAMNNFVNYYIQNILETRNQPQAIQIKVMKLFMDASYSNPLFKDQDTELTLSYYSNASCLTRFSLDTDWRRAVAAIMIALKKQ